MKHAANTTAIWFKGLCYKRKGKRGAGEIRTHDRRVSPNNCT